MQQKLLRALFFILFTAISAIVASLLASIISTQRVLGALAGLDVSTSFSDRLSMTIYDAQHFGSLYGVFVFLGFLAAFFVANDLSSRFPKYRLYWFGGAGMTSMFVMLFLMRQVFFGVPIVAGARDGLGLFLQMVAGGIGGLVFYGLQRRRFTATSETQD